MKYIKKGGERMNEKSNIISWEGYGLIAELAYRVKNKRPQFSKTALQKLIFLLQELYGVDCGYRFDFYIYGPYCSDIEIDLSTVESWSGVKIEPGDTYLGGYNITTGKSNQIIRDKAKDFLRKPEVAKALKKLIKEFGSKSAKDLELISTIVYVAKAEKDISKEKLLDIVKSLKPRFSETEILDTITNLHNKKFIQIKGL